MKQTFLWGIVLALCAAPVAATTVSFEPTPLGVQIGDTFALDVQVSDAADLYAFQFDVAFDPAVVQVNDVLEGDFLATGGATSFVPGAIDNSAGTVTFSANTLLGPGGGVTGGGFVVRFLFQALAAGHSDLSFGNVVLLDSALAELDTTAVSGSITVARPGQVPEPVSALLVGLALAALVTGGHARRRAV